MQFVDGPLHGPSHVLAPSSRTGSRPRRPTEDPTAVADIRGWWADHSGTVNLYRRIRDRLDGDEPEVRLTEAEASAVPADVDAEAVEDATADLLGRGRELGVGPGRGLWDRRPVLVPAHAVLQGAGGGRGAPPRRAANRTPAWVPAIDRLRAGFPPEVVDLADALDGYPDPLFWDTVHTNETGAPPHRRGGLARTATGDRSRNALKRPVRVGHPWPPPDRPPCLWPVGGAITNLRSRCRTSSAATSRWPSSARPP